MFEFFVNFVLQKSVFRPRGSLTIKVTYNVTTILSSACWFRDLMVGCTTNEEPVAKPQLSLTKGEATEVEISNLEAGVTYTIVVAASASGEVVSQAIEMTTKTKGPEPTPEPEYLYDEELFDAKRYSSEELDASLPDNYFFMSVSDNITNPNLVLALMLVGAEEDKTLQAGTL